MAHQLLGRALGDPVSALIAAGYDAIDTGRDVRIIGRGDNIRDRDAVFDPSKRGDTEVMSALPTGRRFT